MEEKKKHRISPKLVFLHFLAIIFLYTVAGSFITLLFQYVNILIPDPVFYDSYGYYPDIYGPLRFAISSLVVIFPCFILVSWLLNREYKKNPETRQLRLRKWLIYFTLFLAAIIMTGDLVAIINSYLNGELSIRFALKALSFIVVAGTIFGYYFWDVKKDAPAPQSKIVAWIVSIIVGGFVIGAFVLIGSPGEARAYRMDQIRVQNLQEITYAIDDYVVVNQEKPSTLGAMEKSASYNISRDPITNEEYEYNLVGENQYELCATFEHNSQDELEYERGGVRFEPDKNWSHTAGHVCFTNNFKKKDLIK
ncbi:MAG: DUF5671 domain-containing protein [bacterium]|nr:DUF5671 domain-containing protein [bacterium]